MAAAVAMSMALATMKASSSSSSSLSPPPAQAGLPMRSIPGTYGWPLLGPLSDRLDYSWFQGPEKFFRARIDKYKSTVFRTNVPPSFPFFFDVNPNVVALLDTESFSHLFDMDNIDKRDVLVGDFMPSVKYTGNLRVCAYLDTSEPKHAQLKGFALDILKRSSKVWQTEVISNLDVMWDTIEAGVAKDGSASVFVPTQKFLFNFLCKSITGADPASLAKVAEYGYEMLDLWLALMILPTVPIDVFQPLPEIFLHSWQYPFALVSGRYNTMFEFVENYGAEAVERGKTQFGLTKEEAIHNLLFILGFNAFGGFSIFIPTLLSTILSDKTGLQEKLREEVRGKVGTTGVIDFESVKEMELVKSVVYETLRLNPPVPLQYGRARKDFQLKSHDSVFDIKKGELLCGYQKLVMKDPKVFDNPETFVPDRFVRNPELLNYLFWSNGPQTGTPAESNKQCAAKDYVPMTAFLMVAYMFRRYDSFSVGSSGSITSVKKASS
ncbi:hypothetical protein MLD38_015769 [Melastoma candidum]|uniref:Uncharacterized protein n=1 Tax=Melastoma candidum TaxID=119954 RepID=A0ACB9RHC1_9MYRT|nr:hypothetical protein MLD38_015769 [Melastoma candidum]